MLRKLTECFHRSRSPVRAHGVLSKLTECRHRSWSPVRAHGVLSNLTGWRLTPGAPRPPAERCCAGCANSSLALAACRLRLPSLPDAARRVLSGHTECCQSSPNAVTDHGVLSEHTECCQSSRSAVRPRGMMRHEFVTLPRFGEAEL